MEKRFGKYTNHKCSDMFHLIEIKKTYEFNYILVEMFKKSIRISNNIFSNIMYVLLS